MLFSADRYLAVIPLLTHAHQLIYRLLSLSKASNPFPEILQQLFGIQSQVSAMSIDPSFTFVQYFVYSQSYCDYDLKYWRIYYNAMLHINIKIMTSQQRWYLLLSYFNNKINFLFSCEICSWSLHFRQFELSGISEICIIFVLGYFILPRPVMCTQVWAVLTGQSTVSGFDLAYFSFLSSEHLCVFSLHGAMYIY